MIQQGEIMNRRLRTEILVEGKKDIARKICRIINSTYEVSIIEEPEKALVMAKCRENGKNGLFYLGEILVTDCRVSLQGKTGIGIVKGQDKTAAYDLAVIDAAYNAHIPECSGFDELLIQSGRALELERQKERNRILSTKVDFSTMNLEV
jgi:alpha-D-ribose 1-methylphosphonate 5-triphosphate synthase subunit PhnG